MRERKEGMKRKGRRKKGQKTRLAKLTSGTIEYTTKLNFLNGKK